MRTKDRITQRIHGLRKWPAVLHQPGGRIGWSKLFTRFIGDSLWAITGQVLSAAGMVLGVRIITEYVSPNVFGTVSLLMGIVALGHGVFSAPILQAMLRMYPDMQRQSLLPLLMTEIRRLLTASNGLLLAVGGAAALIYCLFSKADFIVPLVLGGLVVLEAMRGLVADVLSAENKIKVYSLLASGDIWARQTVAVLLVIVFGASVTAVIGGYLIGALFLPVCCATIFRGMYGRSDVQSEPEQEKQLHREIVEYSRPLIPIALAAWVSGLGDRYIIGGLLGVDAAGIYAAVYALVSKPFLMISTAIELALRQSYYHAVSVGDDGAQARIMYTWIVSTLVASVLCLVAVVFWAEELANLLLGEKFQGGASLMPWIAAGYCLLALSSPFVRRAYAYKKTVNVLRVQAGGAITSVLVATVGTYYYGLVGAAWAVPVYFGCQLALAVYLTRDLLRPSLCLERKLDDE